MNVLVAVSALVAVLVLPGWGRRARRRAVSPSAGLVAGPSIPGGPSPTVRAAGFSRFAGSAALRRRGLGSWWARRGGVGSPTVSLVLLTTEVGSLLRSGASPRDAWEHGAGIAVDHEGIPIPDLLHDRLGAARSVEGAQQCAGVIAGCVVAGQIGAPLAPVLESVARTVVLAQEAQAQRDAALAGPRSTARLLGWLPLLGFVLAAALGADPLGFLFGQPLGLLVFGIGAGLMVIGQRWITVLVRRAQASGTLE